MFEKLKDKFSGEKFSVGLDIGSYAARLAKLKFFKDTVELCALERQVAAADLGVQLKKMAEPLGVKTVNISVGGPSAIVRYVDFPRMSGAELKGALKFEAQKHLPFQAEEVSLDACILKPELPENKMLVMLAAAKKELIGQRLKLLEQAGLSAGALDIDSLALINAFNFGYGGDEPVRSKAVALLNIGSSISNLNIIEGGIPHLSRDIDIAGSHITRKIAEIFSLDFKAAENLKLNPDKDKAEKAAGAIGSVLGSLAGEIKVSCKDYESRNAANVGKIFLSGGSAYFSGIKDMLANLLSMEAEYWDPLRRINLGQGMDSGEVKRLAAESCVAVGLALRG